MRTQGRKRKRIYIQNSEKLKFWLYGVVAIRLFGHNSSLLESSLFLINNNKFASLVFETRVSVMRLSLKDLRFLLDDQCRLNLVNHK